jgi:hypothetical protein
MILHTGVKYFHSERGCNHGGLPDKEHLPHFITSNLEHDAVKLVLEHFAEEGIAGQRDNIDTPIHIHHD